MCEDDRALCCNEELLLEENMFELWVAAPAVGSPPLPRIQCSERLDCESLSESMIYALPSAL